MQALRERFRRNWPGYVAQYRVLLLLTLLAALADMVSTFHFMRHEGPEAEAHPVIRLVSMVLGPLWGPLVGKACQLAAVVAVTVCYRRHAVYVFVPVIMLYGWAAWYNIWGCHLYQPRLLWLLECLGS